MRSLPMILACLSFFFTVQAMAQSNDWTPLLDKNLTLWETYLSYAYKVGYNGNIPKDTAGNLMQPIGYNKEEAGVFSVINEGGGQYCG